MERFTRGYSEFRKKADRELYSRLGKGQSPHSFVISCSDSRIVPEEIFSAQAGELFVLRNVGNLAGANDAGFLSALEYAVLHLKVDNIVVLAHSECGAVKALSEKEHIDTEGLQKWLVQEEYDGDSMDDAVKNNGIRQYMRVKENPLVTRAIKEEGLNVELLFFDISSIELERFSDGKWEAIK